MKIRLEMLAAQDQKSTQGPWPNPRGEDGAQVKITVLPIEYPARVFKATNELKKKPGVPTSSRSLLTAQPATSPHVLPSDSKAQPSVQSMSAHWFEPRTRA
jgi:hypothetical protein